VRELALLDRQEEHRPGREVERDVAIFLELAVELEGFREQLVDPGRRLREEEAAVSARRTGSDSARVDEQDLGSGVRE
jgi:hypothetical protein